MGVAVAVLVPSGVLRNFTVAGLKTEIEIPGLWIRVRIGSGFSDFVDPDPYWYWKMHFLVI
jgi:hypothetical protein